MLKRRHRKPLLVGALSVLTVVAVAAGVLYDQHRTSAATTAADTTSYVPPVETAPTSSSIQRNQLGVAMARLNDASRPFNIVVLGDSTGVARRGWVVQLGEALGAKSGRTVTLNPWTVEQEPNGYQPAWGVAPGSVPPITIWNASASGKSSAYTMMHIDEMVPVQAETIDLVIINHGHNEAQGGLVSQGGRLLRTAIDRFTNAAVAVVLQNAERPGSVHATIQDSNIAAWRKYLTERGDPIIDVYTPYMTMPGWENEFDTPEGNLHPSQAGYDMWTGVVRQVLGV